IQVTTRVRCSDADPQCGKWRPDPQCGKWRPGPLRHRSRTAIGARLEAGRQRLSLGGEGHAVFPEQGVDPAARREAEVPARLVAEVADSRRRELLERRRLSAFGLEQPPLVPGTGERVISE